MCAARNLATALRRGESSSKMSSKVQIKWKLAWKRLLLSLGFEFDFAWASHKAGAAAAQSEQGGGEEECFFEAKTTDSLRLCSDWATGRRRTKASGESPQKGGLQRPAIGQLWLSRPSEFVFFGPRKSSLGELLFANYARASGRARELWRLLEAESESHFIAELHLRRTDGRTDRQTVILIATAALSLIFFIYPRAARSDNKSSAKRPNVPCRRGAAGVSIRS